MPELRRVTYRLVIVSLTNMSIDDNKCGLGVIVAPLCLAWQSGEGHGSRLCDASLIPALLGRVSQKL